MSPLTESTDFEKKNFQVLKTIRKVAWEVKLRPIAEVGCDNLTSQKSLTLCPPPPPNHCAMYDQPFGYHFSLVLNASKSQ